MVLKSKNCEMKDQSYKSFTPGKVIISGLYSVIFGEPAVVCSIDWGITAEIITRETKREGTTSELLNDPYFQKIIRIFEKYCSSNGHFSESSRGLVIGSDGSQKVDLQRINLKISSNLPRNSGLGSSAAFAASVLKVLFSFFEVKVTKDELIDLVWQAENYIHGTSSGLDVTAVVVGGLLSFQRVNGEFVYEQIVQDFDFNEHFTLLDSGKSVETTGEMVAMVKGKLQGDEIIKDVFEEQGRVSIRVAEKLRNGDNISEETRRNHELLVSLGVVGVKAQRMIAKCGGAKITGAGGVKGGSGFVLVVRDLK